VTPEIAARLAACEIQMAAEAQGYCMLVRGNCLALVRTEGDRFTSIGSSGMLTENGLAYLVWADGKAMLVSHGSQVEAAADQVEAIRKFSEDLREILGPPMNADESG
jgi:hypothetical protein